MLRDRLKRTLAKHMKRIFSDRAAIDLGTVNTLIFTEKHGIVLNEPSAIAINKHTGEVVAIGREAMGMLGREPIDCMVHRPMRDGNIADYDMAEKMLSEFLKLAGIGKSRKFLHVVAGTPSLSTGVERRALRSASRDVGASWVSLVEEGLAAVIGAGVKFDSSQARMVVDIGGGTTNITIASALGVIYSSSLRVAGNEMNHAVSELVLRKYRMMIGEQTAEMIKIQLGAAFDEDQERTIQVVGKSVPEYIVKEFVLTNTEISQTLERSVQAILDGVRSAIEQAAANVAVDIFRSGITLTGGGALLKGLDWRLSNELQLPVRIADRPLEAVALGAGFLLSHLDILERYQLREETLEWETANMPNYSQAG